MKTLISVLFTAAVATLSGCAATGVKVSDEQASSFVVGQSKEADVVSRLGPPTTRSRNSDGTVVLQYVYAEAQVRAATFVPIVGLFAGGTDVKSNAVTFTFSPDGKLLSTSSAASNYGTGVGASSGTNGTTTQQPR